MRYLILILILFSCAEARPKPKYDGDLHKLVSEFMHDCSKYHADLDRIWQLESVRYEDPSTPEDPTRVGECLEWKFYGSPFMTKIRVSHMPSEVEQRALMYHELGHCVLSLGHMGEYTLMAAVMRDEAFYQINWDDLVADLCNRYNQ